MNLIFFDLEGPLATQDNAYELMRLFPTGGKIFEVISRYDDLLTLENKPGYEPGDTLALIAPFLVYHGIKEADITDLARKATFTKGATQLISRLNVQGWNVFCISTSYQQYALYIAQKLGILSRNVACTSFPLDKLPKILCKEDFSYLAAIENDILNMQQIDDAWIKIKLDQFYWGKLPDTGLRIILDQVKPVGGQRKVDALRHFAQAQSEPLSNCVAVGDSITDFKMLQTVDCAGGLAIAFNANEYALPYATMGLASTHLDDLWPISQAWKEGKRTAVQRLIKEKERASGDYGGSHLHWLSGTKDIAALLEIHKRFRSIVRKEAAKLG
jgi:energy-converting hydrogenase A subunit R